MSGDGDFRIAMVEYHDDGSATHRIWIATTDQVEALAKRLGTPERTDLFSADLVATAADMVETDPGVLTWEVDR